MIDYIIIAIIASIIILGRKKTIDFLKGNECNCGATKKKIEKVLEGITHRKVFKLRGLHCDGCKKTIEYIINSHPNLKGEVKLNKKELIVSYNADVEDEKIIAALEKGGYSVTSIALK